MLILLCWLNPSLNPNFGYPITIDYDLKYRIGIVLLSPVLNLQQLNYSRIQIFKGTWSLLSTTLKMFFHNLFNKLLRFKYHPLADQN